MADSDSKVPEPLWRLNDVTLRGVGRARLDRVSLEIRTGSTAVIGYSGAGKTSLLNLLVEFERADDGVIEFVKPPDRSRLPIFWVPQTDGMWPHLTVVEHLTTVLPHDASTTAANELLAAFDLSSLRDARPDRLSQGERSRVAVARALASHAAVLVMDEPLAHVDPARVGTYWNVVRDHCRATATSLVLATHSPEIVLHEAERVVCLNDGRVVFTGAVADLYHQPPSAELARFLGPINWFAPDEATGWLSISVTSDVCLRPERLSIASSPAGHHVVRASRFAGSVAEVELADEQASRVKTLYHRPSGDELRPGDRVVVQAVGIST
ncbi:MAG: ATP-binding cassette domain-containing protein [Planctomycetales bacterium]|nr:ATP-binding cassette domain-containing protein [Planctomycetales bacterium]